MSMTHDEPRDEVETILGYLEEPSFRALETIIAIEPEIRDIINEAGAIRDPDWHDYESLKRRLKQLVGWLARNPRLQTSDAYDAAMHKLTEVLRI